MSSGRRPIQVRQNEPDMIELQAASARVNQQTQRIELGRTTIALVLAASGLLAVFLEQLRVPLAIAGAVWAIALLAWLGPWAKRTAARSAVIQEMLDTELFGLPWNSTLAGPQIAHYDISRLARSLSQKRAQYVHDWYVDTSGIPRPYDVFLCQLQNLGWDSRLRGRWAVALLVTAGVWVALGAVVGLSTQLSLVSLLLSWYVPALPALVLAVDGYRTHREIAEDRDRVGRVVRQELDSAAPGATADGEQARLVRSAREVQDVVLLTRRPSARVPQWFYAVFRARDEQDFHAMAAHLAHRLAGASGSDSAHS